MARLPLTTLILASLALAGCDRSPAQPATARPPVPVRVATVSFTTRQSALVLSGTVQARTLSELAFGSAERSITALPVQVGQVVAAGQTIATLARTAEPEVVVDVPENRLPGCAARARCGSRSGPIPRIRSPGGCAKSVRRRMRRAAPSS